MSNFVRQDLVDLCGFMKLKARQFFTDQLPKRTCGNLHSDTYLVGEAGFEPASLGSKSRVLPLDDSPV